MRGMFARFAVYRERSAVRVLGNVAASLLLAVAAAVSGCLSSTTAELIESSPVETSLDHVDLRDAKDVWPQMLAAAAASIDMAEFYVSSASGSVLEPVLRSLAEARHRGVKVRLLVDSTMTRVYPETLAALSEKGVMVRSLDLKSRTGGVLHAKYFVIDGREAFVGSQNLDWRSLMHIRELGVRLTSPELAQALTSLFEADWALAGQPSSSFLRAAASGKTAITFKQQRESVHVELAFSPQGMLFREAEWDLPQLVALIDSARRSVAIELLVYRGPESEETETPMARLEAALRRAARRGVDIRLILSDWMLREPQRSGLASLRQIRGVTIKIAVIPRWSGGEIPYARIVHAKYMVVDGRRAWIGTSNWENRYFLASRNVSVFLTSDRLGARLERFFAELWNSPYARLFSDMPPSPRPA